MRKHHWTDLILRIRLFHNLYLNRETIETMLKEFGTNETKTVQVNQHICIYTHYTHVFEVSNTSLFKCHCYVVIVMDAIYKSVNNNI